MQYRTNAVYGNTTYWRGTKYPIAGQLSICRHILLKIFLAIGGTVFWITGVAQYDELSKCNITWNTQRQNAAESMPCGGGDIGLNVWVEKGELLCYLSKSGTFDENNTFLKLGRVR